MKFVFLFYILILNCTLNAAQFGNKSTLKVEDLKLSDIQNSNDLFKQIEKADLVLIDFWASWCGPCAESLPTYNKIFKSKNGRILVIGASMDESKKDSLDFLKKTPLDFPIIWDEKQSLAKKLKIEAIPTSYLFNKEMILIETFRGFNSDKKDKMIKKIDTYLN